MELSESTDYVDMSDEDEVELSSDIDMSELDEIELLQMESDLDISDSLLSSSDSDSEEKSLS